MKERKIKKNKSLFNRWEEMFDAIDQPIVILDKNRNIIEVNTATVNLTGKSDNKILGKKCYEIFHCGKNEPEGCPFYNALEFKSDKISEMAVEALNGFYLISCSPIYDDNGEVEFIIHIATDITKRKKNEELLMHSIQEKEVLLKEIHHRVKNNFQIISSLLSLQANNIKDDELLDLFNNAIYRIRSMALIHEHLYQSSKFDFVDFKSYLNTLIYELYENYKVNREIDIDIKIDNVFLDNNEAIHCGLIINEILTNSFKYAFSGVLISKPKLSISFENSTDNSLELKISDNGIGLPEGFNIYESKTLGMSLVTSLVSQIGGTLQIDGSNGTVFTIKFKKKI